MTSEQAPNDGLAQADVSTIIAMAWQDNTPFEAIAAQFGLSEQAVVELMRGALKTRSFRVWRMRVRGRTAKHQTRQISAQRDQHAQYREGSGDLLKQALSEAQETFPLPPSPLSRESLR
jgi:uncharacterized protein (TIGR03643 family)